MDQETYNSIIETINQYKGFTKDLIVVLERKYSAYSHDTLYSILSLEYQKRMKLNHIKSPANVIKYWNLYKESIQNGENSGIILRMSLKFDVCPCLIAKLILQKYLEEFDDNKISTYTYLRDTKMIPDPNLAYEIFLCTIYDNLYSPLTETMKHSLGQQYEIKLHNEAIQLGLVFRNEEELRKNGYDKTPDIKLEIPVAIDGFVVNWIESKALFGTQDVHKDYTNKQYLSYWNRFGPGLIIYWFGFCRNIVDSNDRRFIIRDCLSSNVFSIKTK